MKKVVGVTVVAALLACGARAQADPVSMGQYSGFEPFEQSWSSHDKASWSQFANEVREWIADHDDDDPGAFVSFVQARWASGGVRWTGHDDGEDGRDSSRFLHGILHGHVKPAKAARFWARMHEAQRTGCLPRGPRAPEVAATPEPASMLLLGTGALGLLRLRKRKQS